MQGTRSRAPGTKLRRKYRRQLDRQLELQRARIHSSLRTINGSQFLLSYTYAKSIDQGSSLGEQLNSIQRTPEPHHLCLGHEARLRRQLHLGSPHRHALPHEQPPHRRTGAFPAPPASPLASPLRYSTTPTTPCSARWATAPTTICSTRRSIFPARSRSTPMVATAAPRSILLSSPKRTSVNSATPNAASSMAPASTTSTDAPKKPTLSPTQRSLEFRLESLQHLQPRPVLWPGFGRRTGRRHQQLRQDRQCGRTCASFNSPPSSPSKANLLLV